MRMVTFNIHHGTVGTKGPVDPDQLGEVCASFDADVLALQEVDVGTIRVRGRDLAAIVAERCGMDHVFGSSQRMLGGRYGNVLAVRGLVLERAVTRLPKVPRTRFWQEQRTVTEVRTNLDGTEIWLAATHLAVKAWNNGPQLKFLLDHLQHRPGLRVLLGDLNMAAEAVAPHAREHGLSLVDHRATFPARSPRLSIDHCLVSQGITATNIEVRSTAMSDHAALIVDVAIAAR